MTPVWQMIMLDEDYIQKCVRPIYHKRVIKIGILTSHVLQQHSNVGVENLRTVELGLTWPNAKYRPMSYRLSLYDIGLYFA